MGFVLFLVVSDMRLVSSSSSSEDNITRGGDRWSRYVARLDWFRCSNSCPIPQTSVRESFLEAFDSRNTLYFFRTASGSTSVDGAVTGDNDKRDILDLLKLSYIVVRTGIGTGQIMVMKLIKEKNDKMNM